MAGITDFLLTQRAAQTEFLAELVRTPSDNPPADCAAHAAANGAITGSDGTDGRAPRRSAGTGARARIDLDHQPCRAAPLRRRSDDRVERARRRGAAGRWLDRRSLRRRNPRRLDVRPRRRGFEIRFCYLCVCPAGFAAMREKNSAARVELHLTYDEELGGELGPAWLLREGISRPDFAICAGFSYAVIEAHNGVSAPRGRGHRPLRTRGETGDRDRCAGSGDAHPRGALRLAHAAGGAGFRGCRHRRAAAQRRADRGRHQYQRRARPGDVPHRPAHRAGGEARRGRARTARRDRAGRGGVSAGADKQSAASCSPRR